MVVHIQGLADQSPSARRLLHTSVPRAKLFGTLGDEVPTPAVTVVRIVALVLPWSGVQILTRPDAAGSNEDDSSVSTVPAGDADRLHVSARLTALLADGRSVTSQGTDFGISLSRDMVKQPWLRRRTTGSVIRGIEGSINKMLGRDPKVHRPPRLAWDGLIDALTNAAVTVTENELIAAELTIDLSPETTVAIEGFVRASN